MGNKGLVANEECDDCNERFGNTIEKDLISYLDIYRVMYGVSGKNGIPTLEFDENVTMKYVKKNQLGPLQSAIEEKKNDKGIVTLSSQNINFDKETKTLQIDLKSKHYITSVNIYKAFCKIAIGLIDSDELPYLKDTVSWINSTEEEAISLPKIASIVCNTMFVDSPIASLYVRKGNDEKLPHIVGEFRFKSFIYVFIVPFSKKDKVDFTDCDNYNYIWKFFKHFDSLKNWVYNDFSSTKSKKYIFDFKMVQEERN